MYRRPWHIMKQGPKDNQTASCKLSRAEQQKTSRVRRLNLWQCKHQIFQLRNMHCFTYIVVEIPWAPLFRYAMRSLTLKGPAAERRSMSCNFQKAITTVFFCVLHSASNSSFTTLINSRNQCSFIKGEAGVGSPYLALC
jgi:hypothetical protein